MAIARFGANLPNDFYKAEVWSGLTLERWYAEGVLPKIFNTNYEGEIKKYGQIVHIRRNPDAVINPYVVDTPVSWNAIQDDKTTLTIDYAYYAAHKIDTVDLAQMDIEIASKIANAINKQMMMKENQVCLSALPSLSYNPLNLVDKSGATQTTVSTDANYIIKAVTPLRTAFNRRRVPKEGRYILVSPEVEELLLMSDLVRYDAMGKENVSIQTGNFGLRLAGFDIIPSEFVPSGGTNIYNCIAGVKDALTFARQVTEVDLGVPLQDYFGKGMKALNVFGFALTQPDGMGIWKVKVA